LFGPAELAQFAAELEQVHATLSGSARLADESGQMMVCVTALGSAGRIVVGGEIRSTALLGQERCDDKFCPEFDSQIAIRFDGIATDQTHLPSIVHAIRRMITH
jgi:hypothetical protein